MAVAYTHAKATLAQVAAALAAEATAAGQTSLASSLTSFSTEISDATVTEAEFFGGAEVVGEAVVQRPSVGVVWSQILDATAGAVLSKSNNVRASQQTTMAAQQTTMASQQTTMAAQQTIIATEAVTSDNHLATLASTVEPISLACTSGPHIKMAGGGCPSEGGDWARAMMMLNLKGTNKLDEFRAELLNPTPLLLVP